jgi:histidine triad (HIT) family protein
MASIFTKIINGEIKGRLIHRDDQCVVLVDVDPKAPKHFLVIPKKEIRSVAEATKDDQALLGHLVLTAAKVAKDQGFSEEGYRLVINVNEDGGMTVPHIHVHLLGGRHMNWPPG